MNKIEVSKHLPCYKFELLQTPNVKQNDNWISTTYLIISAAKTVKDAIAKKYTKLYIEKFSEMEDAFLKIMQLYVQKEKLNSSPLSKVTGKIKNKITFKEYVRGRDGGSEWADPENDIVKSGGISVEINIGANDYQIYDSNGFNPNYPMFGICNAYCTYTKLLEGYWPSKTDQKNIVGFKHGENYYIDPYIIADQMCVCGTNIKNGDRIKEDYFKSYMFFQYKDKLYLYDNICMFNGEEVDMDYVVKYCEVENAYKLTYCNESIMKKLKEIFPTLNGLDYHINGAIGSCNIGGNWGKIADIDNS